MISYIRDAEPICTNAIQNIHILNYISKFLTEIELNNVKLALQTVEVKKVLVCEIPCRMKLGKSLTYARFLKAGSILTADMICAKVSEPYGISAELFSDFIGRKLLIEVHYEENLMENHFVSDFKNTK